MKKYYNEGWNAFSNQLFRSDNPYKKGTTEFSQWLMGYEDHYENLYNYIDI